MTTVATEEVAKGKHNSSSQSPLLSSLSLQERAERAGDFLSNDFVHALLNIFMVECFSHDHFSNILPESWVQFMSKCDMETLKHLAFGEVLRCKEDAPADMLQFLHTARNIALPRVPTYNTNLDHPLSKHQPKREKMKPTKGGTNDDYDDSVQGTNEKSTVHDERNGAEILNPVKTDNAEKGKECREIQEVKPGENSSATAKRLNNKLDTLHFQPVQIETFLRSGMNPKKVHEVALLDGLIDSVAQLEGIKTVVDFGSGKGYLGQVLSVVSALRVVGIECQEHLNIAALHKSELIVAWAKRKQAALEAGLVCGYSPAKKDAAIYPVETVTTIVRGGEDIDKEVNVKDGALITGLHTCGDLHTSLLRIFCESSAQALVSVGCCYHRRTEENTSIRVFPISETLNRFNGILSRKAMELACHAREVWIKHDDSHFYGSTNRAMLEKLFCEQLPDHDPGMVKIGRMKLKKGQRPTDGGSFSDFEHFATEVVRRLKQKVENTDKTTPAHSSSSSTATACAHQVTASSSTTPPTSKAPKLEHGATASKVLPRWELLSAEKPMLQRIYDACIPLHKAVVGLYALRVLLATVVETLLLCDRVLYLEEHEGIKATVFPLFDPAISSRNFVIVATKQKQLQLVRHV